MSISAADLAGGMPVRWFSLGRHALAAGLALAGFAPGKRVLLPEFICREVPDTVVALGGECVWFEVAPGLAPLQPPSRWPVADAVVAVDYFGFPQPLGPFREYCRLHGALLLEDNAHGALSRDEGGALLGTRGDLGIVSLRKTFPVADGALLIVADAALTERIPAALEPRAGGAPVAIRVKRALQWSGPARGPLLRLLTAAVRAARRLATGRDTPDLAALAAIPAAPSADLFRQLARLQPEREIARRRDVYQRAASALRAAGIAPLASALPAGTSPWAVAYRASGVAAARARESLESLYLDPVRWPELPATPAAGGADWYPEIWIATLH